MKAMLGIVVDEPDETLTPEADLEPYLKQHLPRRLVRRAERDYKLSGYDAHHYEMDNERFERELANIPKEQWKARFRSIALPIAATVLATSAAATGVTAAIEGKTPDYQQAATVAGYTLLFAAALEGKRALDRRKERQNAFYENTMPLTLFNARVNRFAGSAEITDATGSVKVSPEWKLSYDASANTFTIQQQTTSQLGSETHAYTTRVNNRADIEALVAPMPLRYRGAAANVGANLVAVTRLATVKIPTSFV